MGAVLLTAGAAGKRYALPNSRIMIHQPLAGMQGTAEDIMIHARELIRNDSCDAISLYPGKNGGIRKSHAIAQFGRETCLAFVRATIGQAIGYEVTGDAMVVVSPGFVFIQVPSMYSYPTGDVPSTDGLVSTNDGGLGFFFDCTAAG